MAHIPAGETVGEMSLISGEEHSAQLVALRDTELLRVSPQAFNALIARHPRVMLNLMRLLVKRLHKRPSARSTAPARRPLRSFPCRKDCRTIPSPRRLADALTEIGVKAAVLDAQAAEQTADWFSAFEADHDVVFYCGDAPDGAWTQQCLRQADRVLLLARTDRPVPLRPLEMPAFKARATGLPELLLLHPDFRSGSPRAFRAQERPLRIPSPYPCRLHRGRAPSGALRLRPRRGPRAGRRRRARLCPYRRDQGAARSGRAHRPAGRRQHGRAHRGRACGGMDHQEFTERMRTAFVESNPLSDYTFP